MYGWALLAGCWALLAGCSAVRPPAPDPIDAAALSTRLGEAACISASLLVKTLPREGDGVLLTLRLWSEADGRTLVKAKKLDLDVLEALVEADGRWLAWLPRGRARSGGRMGEGPAPQLLRDLRLLLDELKRGPLPPGELACGADGLPQSKRIPGRVRLGYARWAAFEGLQRPTAVSMEVDGDETRYELRLKALEPLPAISPERMRLEVPADVPEVPAEELLRRLDG